MENSDSHLAFENDKCCLRAHLFKRGTDLHKFSKTSIQRLSISALTSACAVVLLAACGGGGGSGAMPDAAAAQVQTVAAADAVATNGVATSGGASATQTSSSGATLTASTAVLEPGPAATAPGPYGQDANSYTATFADEFENGLDGKVWNDTIWYQASNPTKNYAVENGALKIWPQRDASGKFFDRTIDTDGKYYQTYGYFEIEAKLPKGKGTWPAFWLFNHIGDRRPEMDIMEAYAGGEGWGVKDADGIARPTAYAATVWKGDKEGQQVGFRMFHSGMDLSETFNKYAVKWEPNKQTYYFNGQEVLTVNVTMPDPMYIMLDLWYGSASGTPDDSTPQGKTNSYEVNYVRAWKFK
jgi:beta-glucanase (GH16 family)